MSRRDDVAGSDAVAAKTCSGNVAQRRSPNSFRERARIRERQRRDPRLTEAQTAMQKARIQQPEADELLNRSPLAATTGMLLDQQAREVSEDLAGKV